MKKYRTSKKEIRNDQSILVWPWFIRLFHWLLVICILGSYLTIEALEEEQLHAYFGYIILILVCFRIIYGCITNHIYTKLSVLFLNIVKIPTYILSMLKKNKIYYLGHNPLGGVMVLVLLVLLFVQACIGLFLSGQDFDAPLYLYVSDNLSDQLAEVHEILFNFIIFCVIFHISAVIFYKIKYKENLIIAMINGKKQKNNRHDFFTKKED